MTTQSGNEVIDLATIREIADLETHIQHRLGGLVRNFRLAFPGKGFVLQGRAPTYYAKQLAQHAVMDVTGLPVLANEIEVS